MSEDDQQANDCMTTGLDGVARAALTRWGFTAGSSVTLVNKREKAVFSVTDAASSARYAVRVHRAG